MIFKNNFFFLLFFKSDDEATDAESEKEIERNLMLQKEQVKKNFFFICQRFKWIV
jgi:hypothetical protein